MDIERLVCHPRLSFIAGLESARPAVRVWDGSGRELAVIGGDVRPYAEDDYGHDRRERTPGIAWHPHEPVLLVPTGGGVIRWTPDNAGAPADLPAAAAYRWVAFTPDGRSLLAMPSASGEDGWDQSDVVDLEAGAVGIGPGWDTGVALHPAGGIVAALRSDQGATLVVFAKAEGTSLRLLRRALILDVDGYEAPVFSPDGRYFAIRGNAYVHLLEVFAFPSLRRVLRTQLGTWDEAWSLHNVAFGPQPGRLFVGTPAGTLLSCDVERREAVEHEFRAGSAVTAVAATADGPVVVAAGGALRFLPQEPGPAAGLATVREFLAGAPELPADLDDLEEQLELTDGEQRWGPGDLEHVTEATGHDPMWLQRQAAFNTFRNS